MEKLIPFPGGGEYVDVDWSPHDGLFMAAAIQQPGRIVVGDVQMIGGRYEMLPLAWLQMGRWCLFLRMAVDDGGWAAMVMQDGRDKRPDGTFHPAPIVIFNGSNAIMEVTSESTPPAFGEQGVEIVNRGNGWWVFIQVDPQQFFRGHLTRDGRWGQRDFFPIPLPFGTSQGFSDGTKEGHIRFRDQWRLAYSGIIWPSEAGGIAIGQNLEGPDRIRGRRQPPPDAEGKQPPPEFFTVYRGAAFEPHLVYNGAGAWMAAARTPAGPAVVLLQEPFVPEATVPNEPPPPPPPPPPDPEPEPEKENPPMDMPTAVREEVVRFVTQRPPNFTMQHGDAKDEHFREYTGELASHLAFKFGPNWGTKRASNGRPNSKDSIAFQDDRILYGFDIFTGVGTNNTRLQIGTRGKNLTDPLPENEMTGNQVFVAPPAFGTPEPKNWLAGSVDPPTDPGEPDPPTDPGTPIEDDARLFAALDRYFKSRKFNVTLS